MTGLPHDHPSVETVRGTAQRHGSGLRVGIPDDRADAVPEDEVVRVVLDGDERHARVESHATDDHLFLSGVYDAPTLARDPRQGTDRLGPWLDDRDRSAGDSVLVDVLDEGFRYGLRAPGETATYEDRSAPDDGLASIARDLEDRS